MSTERRSRLAVAIALSVILFSISHAVEPWRGYGGTASRRVGDAREDTPEQPSRISVPLTTINDANALSLGLAWHADIPTADSIAANPLVADGLVYRIGHFFQEFGPWNIEAAGSRGPSIRK